MRRFLILSSLLLGLAGSVAGYWAYVLYQTPIPDAPPALCTDPVMELVSRVPVPNNRGAEVLDGHRGERHPYLHKAGTTELTASWIPPKTDLLDPTMRPGVRRLYTELKVAIPKQSYSERDFLHILPPETVKMAGQIWALEPAKFAGFLQQFHPAVSTKSASVGRRPGPDGAFAILRGVSDTHVDIVFRVHAEFDLLPGEHDLPLRKAWYSPACFLGRLVVDRSAGTVEYFHLFVPTDSKTNVHTTMWIIDGPNGGHFHNMHRVDRMDLVGGNRQSVDAIRWSNQVDLAEAHNKLAKTFYKFKEIDFLPFEKTLAAAKAQKKPIFAFVALGSIDDQSC